MSAAVLHQSLGLSGYATSRNAPQKPSQAFYLQQQPAQQPKAFGQVLGQRQQLQNHQQQQHQHQLQSAQQQQPQQPQPAAKPRPSQVLRPIDANQMRPNAPIPAKFPKSYQPSLHPHPYQLQHQQLPHQPAAVLRRNARERNRVKQVNNGFTNLRQHIPGDVVQAITNGGRGASKKLSKVDTLKVAVEYIRRLQTLLMAEQAEQEAKEGQTSAFVATSEPFYFPKAERMGDRDEACMSPTPSSFSDHSSSDLSVGETLTSGSGYSCGNSAPPIGGYRYQAHGAMQEDDELLELISIWQQGQEEE